MEWGGALNKRLQMRGQRKSVGLPIQLNNAVNMVWYIKKLAFASEIYNPRSIRKIIDVGVWSENSLPNTFVTDGAELRFQNTISRFEYKSLKLSWIWTLCVYINRCTYLSV